MGRATAIAKLARHPESTGVPQPLFVPALELHAIVESPLNPRRRYDAKAMMDLEHSLRTRGIDTPIIVREQGDKFEIGAGHRRCRAARAVGMTTVPALIREMTDEEFIELLNVDNLQRADIDPLDEALGYEQLLQHGHTAESLATRLGKSATYVASRMRLLQLGDAAREALQRDLIPLTHAIELAKLTRDQQHELLEELFGLDPEKLVSARAAAMNPPEPNADDATMATDAATDTASDARDDDDVDDDSERFARVRGGYEFSLDDWSSSTVPTVDETRRFIKEHLLRRLKVVPWDLSDAELVPEAGACATCPKRTGNALLLFAEFDTGDDACTDDRCFATKRQAYAARETARESEAAAERGDVPAPTKPQKAAPIADPMREQDAKRKKLRERRLRGRTAAIAAVLEEYDVSASATRLLPHLVAALLHEVHTDVLARMLVMLGMDTSAPAQSHGFGFRLNRLSDWATDGMRTQVELWRALMFLSLGDESGVDLYNPDRKPTRLLAFAKLLRVDVVAIAKAAETVTTPPKKAAPAAKKGTSPAAKATAKKAATKPVKKVAAKKPAKVAKKAPAKKAAKKVVKKSAKR